MADNVNPGVVESSAPVDAGAGDGSDAFTFPTEFSTMGDLDGVSLPEEASPPSLPTPPSGPETVQPPSVPSPAPPSPSRAAPQQPGAPAAAPAARPTQAPPAQPAQQPQQPGAVPPQAPQAPGTPSFRTPQELVGELSKARNDLVGVLANGRFKVELGKDEVTALENDAVAALPTILSRLGAQLYFEAATTTINQIANMVPRMIEQWMTDNSQSNDAVDAFSKAWPQIDMKNVQVQGVVNQVATAYRSMNPQATREQAIAFVGQFVSQQLQLPSSPAPRGGNGPRAPRAPSFAPAGGAGHAQPRTAPGQGDSPFSGMGMSFDE